MENAGLTLNQTGVSVYQPSAADLEEEISTDEL
jgi:hypothetical protein